MRVVVIGGTGHIGTFLTPRLVDAGFDVVNVSRSLRHPYQAHGAWRKVRQVSFDRETEEVAGAFGKRIRELDPDAVIDLTCYRIESARMLVEALRDRMDIFYIAERSGFTGRQLRRQQQSWGHDGRSATTDGGRPKSRRTYWTNRAAADSRDRSASRPSGWAGMNPLNPAGNFNPQVFADLANGREIALPNLGRETLHHVHADDCPGLCAEPGKSLGGGRERAFMLCRPQRSRFKVMRRAWRNGSVRKRAFDFFRGRSGARRLQRKTRKQRGTILRAHRIAASRRRGGFWITGRATDRSKRFANR